MIIDTNTIVYLIAIAWSTFFSYLAIKTRDILYSAVFLVGMYVASAWALIILGSWFLALFYLFVNAGGVLVLIIFAAMLTRPTIDIPPTKSLSRAALLNSFLLILLIGFILYSSKFGVEISLSSNVSAFLNYLFSDYAVVLIFLSVAALAIFLGSIYVASEEK